MNLTARKQSAAGAIRFGLILTASAIQGWFTKVTGQISLPGQAGVASELGPTARALIDRAVEGGRLTREQGLLYRLFALTGDTRLPSEYRGSRGDSLSADGSAVREVAKAFPTLSSAAQAAAAPYFQPPIYPGSWYEPARQGARSESGVRVHLASQVQEPGPEPLPREGWRFTDNLTIPIRVWHLADDPKLGPRAVFLSRQIEKAWPMLTGVMGRAPLSDAGPHPFVQTAGDTKGAFDAWGDGGNGRFDIYLLPLPGWQTGGAVTMAYPPGCSERPAFMLVDSRVDSRKLAAAAVHEFMHAIEFAFKVGGDCAKGWDEATAHWALNHVLPTNNFEHSTEAGGRACIQYPGATCNSYEAWVFALYLDRTHGPEVIRRSWELMAQYPAWRAVNAAIPGGLQRAWPDFARHGWNQPPYTTYEEWDAFLAKPLSPGYDTKTYYAAVDDQRERFPDQENPVALEHREIAMLPTPIHRELELDGKLRDKIEVRDEVSNPLSRNYLRYSLSDKRVRYLRITHPYKSGGPVSIQAMRKKPDSTWVTEDWTTKSEVTICRNEPEEDLTELVLVTANATPDGKPLERIAYVPGSGKWPSTGKATIEMRTICPTTWRIVQEHRQESSMRGTNYTLHHEAVVRELGTPDPEAGHNFEGKGRFDAQAVDYRANCLAKGPDPTQHYKAKGEVRATASIESMGGDSVSVSFSLDPVVPEGAENAAAAHVLYSAGGGLLIFRGSSVNLTRVDTLARDNPCQGLLRVFITTRVERLR